MNSGSRSALVAARQNLLTAICLFASCTMLLAQGYIYSLQGSPSLTELDGSYLVLSNAPGGAPAFSDLLDIKILDSFGPTRVFNVTVSPQDFNITAFGPQGFTGSIVGLADSNTGHTAVRFVGLGETLQPGIYASDNGFFPGNPNGEFALGNWIATPLPEPNVGMLALVGLAGSAIQRFLQPKRLPG